jgi:hypothetical protein
MIIENEEKVDSTGTERKKGYVCFAGEFSKISLANICVFALLLYSMYLAQKKDEIESLVWSGRVGHGQNCSFLVSESRSH